MTTSQMEEVLHDVMADRVGEHIEVLMKALNKRGTMRLEGTVVSVHRHGFVVGESSRRVFVTFSDLFCLAAQVVDGAAKERLTKVLRELRTPAPAAAS
jgi:hypothetical protein